jgi:uncharacterized protein YggE
VEVTVSRIAIAFTLVLLASVATAQPVGAQPPDVPVIVTSGEGVVTRAADRAWVTIRAESRSKEPKEAQRLNAAAMEAVMARLKGMNLGAETIKTLSYELHPEFDYVGGKQVLRGYVASNSIEVRVDDIERVGEVFGATVGSGATSVGGLRFDLKDNKSAEGEALRLAVRDARARADAAANGAGMRVERVLRIEESRTPIVRPMQQMREMAQVGVANAAPPISAGTIEIRAMVTLTAAIK